MNFLAVETSGRKGSIALLREGEEPVERMLASDGRRHAQTLVADACALLEEHGLGPRDTHCVGVSLGPGSFTGLRVGIVFAKTFGWINKCPIVAVPTLEACAAKAGDDSEHICVISDAQRGEVFFGEYTLTDGCPHALAEVQIVSIEKARSLLMPQSVLTGPGLDKYGTDLAGVCRVADESVWAPQAGVVAKLSRVKLATGNIADPWKLEPVYLRRSAAEEKRDGVGP